MKKNHVIESAIELPEKWIDSLSMRWEFFLTIIDISREKTGKFENFILLTNLSKWAFFLPLEDNYKKHLQEKSQTELKSEPKVRYDSQ